MPNPSALTPDNLAQPNARACAREARRPQRLTAELMARFLAEVAEGWTVACAAERAGVRRRQTLYERRARDPEFAARWDDAVAEGYRVLDAEADAEWEASLAAGDV